jgi:hypothetical protein
MIPWVGIGDVAGLAVDAVAADDGPAARPSFGHSYTAADRSAGRIAELRRAALDADLRVEDEEVRLLVLVVTVLEW